MANELKSGNCDPPVLVRIHRPGFVAPAARELDGQLGSSVSGHGPQSIMAKPQNHGEVLPGILRSIEIARRPI
jgi:hypothetical protein